MKKTCHVLELLFLIHEEDENCDIYECPHNIFWKELYLERHKTETSRRLKNYAYGPRTYTHWENQ